MTISTTHQTIAIDPIKTKKQIKTLLGKDLITIILNLAMKTLQLTAIATLIKFHQGNSLKAKLILLRLLKFFKI